MGGPKIGDLIQLGIANNYMLICTENALEYVRSEMRGKVISEAEFPPKKCRVIERDGKYLNQTFTADVLNEAAA